MLALIHFNREAYPRARECIDAALRVLEKEGVADEDQAARVQELAEEIDKHVPAGSAPMEDGEEEGEEGEGEEGEEEEEAEGGAAAGMEED